MVNYHLYLVNDSNELVGTHARPLHVSIELKPGLNYMWPIPSKNQNDQNPNIRIIQEYNLLASIFIWHHCK